MMSWNWNSEPPDPLDDAAIVAPQDAGVGALLYQPGSMGDPPPPGWPNMPRPGTEPGGPSSTTRVPVSVTLAGPSVAGTTPGDSVMAGNVIPAYGGQGEAPNPLSSARLQQGGGTMPQ